MKNNHELCPFSKPILGKWCQCNYAKLADRCSGKMTCTRLDDLQSSCLELVDAFKVNTRFIIGVNSNNKELTHAQIMKIRCGGLLGIKRVLNIQGNEPIDVRDAIDKVVNIYGCIENFPYSGIVQDIKNFKHRK